MKVTKKKNLVVKVKDVLLLKDSLPENVLFVFCFVSNESITSIREGIQKIMIAAVKMDDYPCTYAYVSRIEVEKKIVTLL